MLNLITFLTTKMKALLNMLNELDDEDIVKIVRLWKNNNE
jgi:hypothetical protein